MAKLLEWIFDSESLDQIKSKFFIIFGVIGSIALTIYILVDVISNRLDLAIVQGSILVVTILTVFASYRYRTSKALKYWAVIPFLIFNIYNFTSGGLLGYAIFWTFILPLTALFIADMRAAIIGVLVYELYTFIYFLANRSGIGVMIYPSDQYFTYLISFNAVFTLSLVTFSAWLASNKIMVKQKEAAIVARDQLQQKVNELNAVRLELTDSNTKLLDTIDTMEKMNKLMVNRELTMVELKQQLNKETPKQSEEDRNTPQTV